MPHPGGTGHGDRGEVHRFERLPRLVFLETTTACPLACVHCRAEAQLEPSPDELATSEILAIIDELAEAGRPTPILVLTGGDCLTRPDLEVFLAYAQERQVPTAVSPSVSPRLTRALAERLHGYGVHSASISLDGLSETHEGIRQIPGHFAATLAAIDLLHEVGIEVQVNTTVMAANLKELPAVVQLLQQHGVRTWEVFFLIGVGRGTGVAEIQPAQYEEICHFLVDVARRGMVVRTVEAPFFRRVSAERAAADGGEGEEALTVPPGELYRTLSSELEQRCGPASTRTLAPSAGTRDGKGIIFVSSRGEVYPAGFLPVSVGNVRSAPLLELYRTSTLLRQIRAAEFTGPCGVCGLRDHCGGSRARAWSSFGDPLASDPGCALVQAAAV